MKLVHIITGLFLAAAPLAAQTPVYLDGNRPVEERIEDALGRMTLEEKIAVIHAQSKFSSPGVARLGIPEIWTTDGPHGIRPEVLWDALHALPPHGTGRWLLCTGNVSVKRPATEKRTWSSVPA